MGKMIKVFTEALSVIEFFDTNFSPLFKHWEKVFGSGQSYKHIKFSAPWAILHLVRLFVSKVVSQSCKQKFR